MPRARTLLLSSLTAATLLTSSVSADDAAPAPVTQEREGFLIGFSLGYGATFPCDVCADLGGEFHVGAMANRRLAVLAEMSIVGGDEKSDGGLMLATIGVQYWPHERFWLKAGVGIGDSLDETSDEERAWGTSVAAGYQVARKGRFAFDVQARGAFVKDRRSAFVSLGFNWY